MSMMALDGLGRTILGMVGIPRFVCSRHDIYIESSL